MVGLVVHQGYERISNNLSVNSASKINKMALLFASIIVKVAFSSFLRTISEIFLKAQLWWAHRRLSVQENVFPTFGGNSVNSAYNIAMWLSYET